MGSADGAGVEDHNPQPLLEGETVLCAAVACLSAHSFLMPQ